LSKSKDQNNGLNEESDVLDEDPKMKKHIFCFRRTIVWQQKPVTN
jgi:hypothetical protein